MDRLKYASDRTAKGSCSTLRIFVDVQSSYDFVIGAYRQTGVQRVESEIAKVRTPNDAKRYCTLGQSPSEGGIRAWQIAAF